MLLCFPQDLFVSPAIMNRSVSAVLGSNHTARSQKTTLDEQVTLPRVSGYTINAHDVTHGSPRNGAQVLPVLVYARLTRQPIFACLPLCLPLLRRAVADKGARSADHGRRWGSP